MENNSAEPSIGYLSLCEISPGIHRGGLLLVDLRGRPVDFRCTSAIRPNSIQKILYGGTLSSHLAVNMCGLPLLKAAGKPMTTLLVMSPMLFGVRTESNQPVLWARRQSDLVAQGAAGLCGEANEILGSEAGTFDTVVVSGHRDYTNDLAEGVTHLRTLSSVIDPLEPFDRISAALKLVQDRAGAA